MMNETINGIPARVAVHDHFVIERWGDGLTISVYRAGHPSEAIFAKSEAEANRLRLRLSDEGLAGYILPPRTAY